MKASFFALAVLLATLIAGCKAKRSGRKIEDMPVLPKAESKLLDPKGTFTLFVSNQSFDIDPVDVSVEIDGQLVVSNYFLVGNQHTFVPYRMNLTKGKHKVRVWTKEGETTLSKTFELVDEDVGVITFFYYPESHYNPTPRTLSFRTQKGPLMIK